MKALKAIEPKGIQTLVSLISKIDYYLLFKIPRSQPSNSWNTANGGRKVHEGIVPPTELHSQPSLHC